MDNKQISLFDCYNTDVVIDETLSACESVDGKPIEYIFKYYDDLNNDISHMTSRDDICTPMECVKTMVDYVPKSFWKSKKIKVLDPCCGNGNFGAYIRTKTNEDNIFYNDLNIIRLQNCKKILKPKHISVGDAFDLKNEFDCKYDLIIANPPYSGGGNKNRSLSNNFIEMSIDRLNSKGYLCFITPNNWMTYNNNNTTLAKLLNEGSFLVIDNDAKKFFPKVGSSFTIILWQKNVFDNKTKVFNNFLLKDIQDDIVIPKNLKFIPLYISQDVINIIEKSISNHETGFKYRCDLHNFTQKKFLSDTQDDVFTYRTIHTPRKTRYASKKQDIYDKWIIVIPLSTYYIPYIEHNVNTTQSVGYYEFSNKQEANKAIKKLTQDYIKMVIHITRYGNFNNIMVLKHMIYDEEICFSESEMTTIKKLIKYIKY